MGTPFLDNAGYLAKDDGLVYSDLDKDLGRERPTKLAVGPAPHAYDHPMAPGYPGAYGPKVTGSDGPCASAAAPCAPAIIVGGVPVADDSYYGSDEALTDGGIFPAPFKTNGGYLGDDQGIVYSDMDKDFGDMSSPRLAVGPAPFAGDRPVAGGYPTGYGPAAAKGSKPCGPSAAPASNVVVVGGAPAPADSFYGDDSVLSDGNHFATPFLDNAGYLAKDDGLVYSDLDKDLGRDRPTQLATGPAPRARDQPIVPGYPGAYGPQATGNNRPSSSPDAPCAPAILVNGVPVADDSYYGDDETIADHGMFPAPFKNNAGYLGDDNGIVYSDMDKDFGDISSPRLTVRPVPFEGDELGSAGYPQAFGPVSSTSDKPGSSIVSAPNAYAFMSGAFTARPEIVSINATVSLTCPGVENEGVNCQVNQLWDGRSCVAPEDCPCITEHNYYTCGSVWKENDGCTNCICIGGFAKCTQEVCETTTCPAGYTTTVLPGECCPSCVPSDKTCEEGLKTIGECWEENCETCECTEAGTKCKPIECPQLNMPNCGDGYELVQKVTGCCPAYECVCDYSSCQNVTQPECGEFFELVAVSVTGACCPDYRCVCAPERCPSVYCGEDERKVRVEGDYDCCPTYTCEAIQCIDKSGATFAMGATFLDPLDHCSQCVCNDDGCIECEKKSCPAISKPKCRDNSTPSLVTTEDGCCQMYTCDCTLSLLLLLLFSGWN